MTQKELELIHDCAIQFEFYSVSHMAKTPPDTAKAETNRLFANRCRVAIGLRELSSDDIRGR